MLVIAPSQRPSPRCPSSGAPLPAARFVCRAEEALADIAHEVIEAQLFRQMAVGGSFDEEFALHVVDDLVCRP